MKKALHKDFWMEIRKNKARFISIFCIVALGVAFFSGIQATSPDMRVSGDAYYDSAQLMDIKVVGTQGLTEKDVKALKETDGVEEAEGAYSTDVLCEEESQKVIHVESVNETVNRLTADKGRIPEKSGECFLDSSYASKMGYEIGDTITFYQDGENDLLKKETYTIVGIGSSPLYISYNRGNTTLGSGEVNGFAYVLPQDFEQDFFTQIYLKAHGAEGLTSYTDAYDNLIEKIQARVEGIEEERCRIRYDEIMEEAEEKLSDARKELEDGKKEAEEKLSDARKELEDGEKELQDGRKEYEDGKKELSDAKKEIEDGKKELQDARKEIQDGWSQLSSAKQQVSDGWAQLASSKEQISSGWEQINSGQKELDSGKAELKKAKEELNSGKKEIQNAKAALEKKQQEVNSGKAAVEAGRKELESTEAQLSSRKQQCESGLAQLEGAEAQIEEKQGSVDALGAAVSQKQGEVDSLSSEAAQRQSEVDAAQAEYDEICQGVEEGTRTQEELDAASGRLQEAQSALDSDNESYGAAVGELEALRQQYDSAAQELESCRQQISAQRAELENGLAAVQDGLAQIGQKRTELSRTEAQLEEGQNAIDQGLADLKKEEAKLASAEKEIAANEKKISQSQAVLDQKKQELSAGQAEIDSGEAELASAQAQISANEQKLVSGEQEIADNEKKIRDGEKEIRENEQKLKDAEKELKDGEKELEDGWKEYEDAKKDADKEIADGEKEIEDAQKKIDDLKEPEWIISDRNSLPEYSDYGDNADRIRNIGEVFPVIFFLVAALISLTTMTRMVEEQRTQIGTLKALGYGKLSIASKYLKYAFLATVGGGICGILIGEKLIPYIIIKAYGIMYHNMDSSLNIHYEWKFALIASLAAVVCTVGATIFACYRELAETPASLMRPPAPKEGKRILLERIGFFWKHLNFTWKSCLRNLFRYKKRLFMTIFGIAGSMGLMLVGFGVQDSISDIAVRQYQIIQHYDGTVIADEDADEKEREELLEYMASNERIERFTRVQLTKITAPRGKSSLSVYLYVPEDLENFRNDVTLQDRVSGESYELTDEGAVICEKTASLLDLKEGDSITLKKDNREYQVKIASITENYMSHFVYMTSKVYRETFGEDPDYSDVVFTMKEEYKEDMNETGVEILEYPAALSISYTSSTWEQVNRMLGTLDSVILILIVSAGLLAFVVLYNLNNINITERQRELATLKVLGFYDMEVSQYVLRENILLTGIGILFGCFLGKILHNFIIVTVEVDAVMFGREIRPISFLYCALLTIGFAAIVNVAMHFKLKKIDMIESLKSVE